MLGIIANALGYIGGHYNDMRYICIMNVQPKDLLPLSPQVFHVLVALAASDQHGYAIMQDVAQRTGGKLRLSPGTLYGSVKRMLEQGLIVELRQKERPRNDDERRRYYRLTPFGRKVAQAEAERMADTLEQARAYGLAPKRA
jgi:DNA-binding PadR family transcriptional regulator